MQFIINDLSVDTVARTIHRGGEQIGVPDLSFDVFVALLMAAPNPLSITELSENVWQSTHVSDETIAQRIALLRKALGDTPKAPAYIRTARGQGYAIIGEVQRIEAVPKNRSPQIAGHGSRPQTALALIAVLLFISAAGYFGLSDARPDPQEAGPSLLESETERLLTRARQQLSLHQSAETDRAIEMLRLALGGEPDHFQARLALSIALSTKATKFLGDAPEETEAEQLARDLIKEQPSSSNAWSALGYALSAQGRAAEALAAYRQAFEVDPANASALSSAAHILLLRGELQQALLLEVKALKVGGSSRYAEIQIAQVLEFINHPAAAVWRAEALSLNPQQAVVLAEIAKSHLRASNPAAALSLLEQYEGDEQTAPQLLVLKGRALLALGRNQAAHDKFAQAGWRGHYSLAALSAIANNSARFEEPFPIEKINNIATSSDPEMHINLAEVFAAVGEDMKALEALSRAVALGWRDSAWIKQSPFLGEILAQKAGQAILRRIEDEIAAQRSLILATESLKLILNK